MSTLEHIQGHSTFSEVNPRSISHTFSKFASHRNAGAAVAGADCEDRTVTGPSRARKEVIYVDLGYWATSRSIPKGESRLVGHQFVELMFRPTRFHAVVA